MTKGAELTKRCADCETVKAVSQFHRNGARGDGYQHICKVCAKVRQNARPKRDYTKAGLAAAKARAEERRNAPKPDLAARQREWKATNPERLAALRKKHYTAKYGMTPEDYDAKIEDQRGQCAICLCDLPERPNIDHDHYNGLTRALLCQTCNLGLGMFLDNPGLLERAATYIEFWRVIHEAADLRVE